MTANDTTSPRSVGRRDWRTWPTYEAAELGLRNFWYPVMWSREVTAKPVRVTLLGETVMLVRDADGVHALHDRCPHRGVPLSAGTTMFPGTITCPYHGWTYRLGDGRMCAVLTDGPRSPLVGKVTIRTYPTAERLGMVFVFVGDAGVTPPPIDDDLPPELVGRDLVVRGRIEPGRKANWRFAAENGFDEGHAKFLHRSAIFTGRRRMPAWSEIEMVYSEDRTWLSRKALKMYWGDEYPGLGRWENRAWYQRKQNKQVPPDPAIAAMKLPGMVSVRLPYLLRVAYPSYVHYEWAVPEDADHHRYVQILVSFRTRPLSRLWFKAKYAAYIGWAFHGQFTGQDAWAVSVMDIPPERLYRPDISVIEWRRMVEEQHR
jgi:phenylpropionate dioxygenase-like ring-hydroxylating dioxygenase large terminal subunit